MMDHMPSRPHRAVPQGGTLAVVESALPSLIPSEQKVAREVIAHPEQVVLMSAAELGGRTNTSPATVIRACQNLGFKGFQHLRLLLLRDAAPRPHDAVEPGDGPPEQWLPSMFRMAGDDIATAFAPLDLSAFTQAVEALCGTHRLLILGNGGSSPIAQLAALAFLGLVPSVQAPADAVMQQLAARTLGRTDVCAAISSSGSNNVTLRAAEVAAGVGATVIGVTSYQHSRLDELTTITLVCGSAMPSWSHGGIAGNLAHIVLFSALQLAVSKETGRDSADPDLIDEAMNVIEHEPGQDSGEHEA